MHLIQKYPSSINQVNAVLFFQAGVELKRGSAAAEAFEENVSLPAKDAGDNSSLIKVQPDLNFSPKDTKTKKTASFSFSRSDKMFIRGFENERRVLESLSLEIVEQNILLSPFRFFLLRK